MTETMTATEFKAKCLKVLDRIARGEVEKVEITKRGRTVGVLVAPNPERQVTDIFGFMRGSVIIPDGFDLTEPVLDEPFDAELGIFDR